MNQGRPRVYDNLRTTNITIPTDLLKTAKDMGLNISEVCREALSNAVGDERRIEIHEKKKKAETLFEGVPKDVIKNLIETSRKWSNVLPRAIESVNTKYGVNIKPEDIEDIQETY